MGYIVTFGELMGRIAPEGARRFTQALPGRVDFTFGGGEANVAVALSLLGLPARFVTALPATPIGDAAMMMLRGCGVDTGYILRAPGRLGLYYLEHGADQRGGEVIYDREGSSLALTPAEQYAWDRIFADACWFHLTGITPAISAHGADAAMAAVRAARRAGVRVSCDLNYRRKLWRWGGGEPRALARDTMGELLPHVDVVIANEEDAEQVLDIHARDTSVVDGRINAAAYEAVAAEISARYPRVSRVAITLRESISASDNRWGAMLYDTTTRTAHFAPRDADGTYAPYVMAHIVDRVGGGDAFAAGLIYALGNETLADADSAVRFAVAASCLKHTIPGDLNYVTKAEVIALMGGQASGRVSR